MIAVVRVGCIVNNVGQQTKSFEFFRHLTSSAFLLLLLLLLGLLFFAFFKANDSLLRTVSLLAALVVSSTRPVWHVEPWPGPARAAARLAQSWQPLFIFPPAFVAVSPSPVAFVWHRNVDHRSVWLRHTFRSTVTFFSSSSFIFALWDAFRHFGLLVRLSIGRWFMSSSARFFGRRHLFVGATLDLSPVEHLSRAPFSSGSLTLISQLLPTRLPALIWLFGLIRNSPSSSSAGRSTR